MAKGDRDDSGGDERRHTDRRLDRIEQDVRDMTASTNEERTQIHEDLAGLRGRLEGHEQGCAMLRKSNDDKWTENAEKMRDTNTKLNAIIGTSFATLLAVCGFFIVIWIDRQNEKVERHVATSRPTVAQNQ